MTDEPRHVEDDELCALCGDDWPCPPFRATYGLRSDAEENRTDWRTVVLERTVAAWASEDSR